jgi:hypothetical protein
VQHEPAQTGTRGTTVQLWGAALLTVVLTVVVGWLGVVSGQGDLGGWLGWPLVIAAAAGLTLVLPSTRRRTGIGIIIGTVIAAITDEVIIIIVAVGSGAAS